MTDKEKIAELEAEVDDLASKLVEFERTMVIGRGGASVSIDYNAHASDTSYKHVLFASTPAGDSCTVELTDSQLRQLVIVAMRAL